MRKNYRENRVTCCNKKPLKETLTRAEIFVSLQSANYFVHFRSKQHF